MHENIFSYVAIYLAAVNLLAIGLTVYDKYAARKNLRRVKERTLLVTSVIGGSVVMFVTMLLIRHKTRHNKFMVGIPVILILQIATVFFFLRHNL